MLDNTLLLDKVTGFKTVIVFNLNHSLRGGVFILSKSNLDMVLVSEFDKFLVEVKSVFELYVGVIKISRPINCGHMFNPSTK